MKISFVKLIAIIGVFLLAASCGPSANNKTETQLYDKSVVAEASTPAKDGQNTPYNPKLIKKGDLTIEAKNIETAKTTLYGFVKKCNGTVMSEDFNRNGDDSYYTISLNIEALLFEHFISLIDSAGLNVVNRSFSVQDVTLQYFDDSTRLQNKKKLESRYLELLSKTTGMKDILEIESKLDEIRTDIEVRQGELNLLKKQIAYSDFSVTIRKATSDIGAGHNNNFFYKLWRGLVNGWDGLKTGIVFLVSLWPLFLFAVLIAILVLYINRKHKLKHKL